MPTSSAGVVAGVVRMTHLQARSDPEWWLWRTSLELHSGHPEFGELKQPLQASNYSEEGEQEINTEECSSNVVLLLKIIISITMVVCVRTKTQLLCTRCNRDGICSDCEIPNTRSRSNTRCWIHQPENETREHNSATSNLLANNHEHALSGMVEIAVGQWRWQWLSS